MRRSTLERFGLATLFSCSVSVAGCRGLQPLPFGSEEPAYQADGNASGVERSLVDAVTTGAIARVVVGSLLMG